MSKVSVPVLVCLALVLGTPLQAQLNDVTNDADFTDQSAKFDFQGPIAGAEATNLLAEWGVTFVKGESGSAEVSQTAVLGFVNNHVLHVHPSGSSADVPLIVNFRYPVTKAGFLLSNGTQQTQVTITALDETGFLIGQVNRQGLADPALIEVATAHPLGISKLLVDYGGEENGEELDNLQIEYLSRPPFAAYLAQVGNGVIPGVGTLSTTIVISNLSGSTAQSEIQFFKSDGNPLDIQIGSVTGTSFPLTLAPYSSKTLTTGGDALAVGYARLQSSAPIEGTGIFRIVAPDGKIVTEAGVGSAKGAIDSVGVVQKVVGGNFDSGIAAVNTANRTVTAAIQLYDQAGNLVSFNSSILSLGPNNHAAQFLSQIFPELQNQSFEGTVRVVADAPLALVILRTINGLVLSSLPVGTTGR